MTASFPEASATGLWTLTWRHGVGTGQSEQPHGWVVTGRRSLRDLRYVAIRPPVVRLRRISNCIQSRWANSDVLESRFCSERCCPDAPRGLPERRRLLHGAVSYTHLRAHETRHD